jgi:GTP pyrophosphokinase
MAVKSKILLELPAPEIDADRVRLFTLLGDRFSPSQIEEIRTGIKFAIKFHGNQKRADGQPYVGHLFRTASYFLMDYSDATRDQVLAALLHDIVEDTDVTVELIESSFGKEVASMVDRLTRRRAPEETVADRARSKAAKLKQLSTSRLPIRLLKCWDLADNALCWKYIQSDFPFFKKLPRWLREAQELYLPLCRITSPSATALIEREIILLKQKGIDEGVLDSF